MRRLDASSSSAGRASSVGPSEAPRWRASQTGARRGGSSAARRSAAGVVVAGRRCAGRHAGWLRGGSGRSLASPPHGEPRAANGEGGAAAGCAWCHRSPRSLVRSRVGWLGRAALPGSRGPGRPGDGGRMQRSSAGLLRRAARRLGVACGGEEGADGRVGGGESSRSCRDRLRHRALDGSREASGAGTPRVVNEGGAVHALEVEGPTGEVETEELEPGESADLAVTLEDGEYELYARSATTATAAWRGRSRQAPVEAARRPTRRRPRRLRLPLAEGLTKSRLCHRPAARPGTAPRSRRRLGSNSRVRTTITSDDERYSATPTSSTTRRRAGTTWSGAPGSSPADVGTATMRLTPGRRRREAGPPPATRREPASVRREDEILEPPSPEPLAPSRIVLLPVSESNAL